METTKISPKLPSGLINIIYPIGSFLETGFSNLTGF